MKARTIRALYDYPIGTEGEYDDFDQEDYEYGFRPAGSETIWMVEVGVDIELVDVPDHLYNHHDDIISAIYWANRLYSKHQTRYVYRTVNNTYSISQIPHNQLPMVARWDNAYFDWELLERYSNRPLGGDNTFYSKQIKEVKEQLERLDEEIYDAEEDDNMFLVQDLEAQKEAAEDRLTWLEEQDAHQKHYLLCSDDDTQHILEDMLFDVVFPDYGATNCIVHYLPDSGEFGEIWVTDDRRWWELGTVYERIK